MAVLGCMSLVLVIIIIIRRWRFSDVSQNLEKYENIFLRLPELFAHLNRIKEHPGRIFVKFESQ